MSSYIRKFVIIYDSNAGFTDSKDLYCLYNNTSDTQRWVEEDGEALTLNLVTDTQAVVIGHCIAEIPTLNPYYYWKEIKEFDLPEDVAKEFGYKYPLRIKN